MAKKPRAHSAPRPTVITPAIACRRHVTPTPSVKNVGPLNKDRSRNVAGPYRPIEDFPRPMQHGELNHRMRQAMVRKIASTRIGARNNSDEFPAPFLEGKPHLLNHATQTPPTDLNKTGGVTRKTA